MMIFKLEQIEISDQIAVLFFGNNRAPHRHACAPGAASELTPQKHQTRINIRFESVKSKGACIDMSIALPIDGMEVDLTIGKPVRSARHRVTRNLNHSSFLFSFDLYQLRKRQEPYHTKGSQTYRTV
jgi:hypothetical protein